MGNTITTTAAQTTTTVPQTTTTTVPQTTVAPGDPDRIINQQNILINLLQDKLSVLQSSENIETFQNISPIILTAESYPDLTSYSNTYNHNIALLDDPNNDIKNSFNTYIYLQDKRIKDLRNTLNNLQNKIQNNNYNKPDIKAFKSMDNSQLLNLETYNITNKNNSSIYPNYLIYGNNGCLQYEKSKIDNNNVIQPATWAFKSCNANEPKQQFITSTVKDLATYNSYIKDPNNQTSILNDNSNILLGFNVVNPMTSSTDQCLQLNNDGISVMPCNLLPSQRFKPFYNNVIN